MSHFGRQGPPDIADTYSLLVLNITFRNLSLSLSLSLSVFNSILQPNTLFCSLQVQPLMTYFLCLINTAKLLTFSSPKIEGFSIFLNFSIYSMINLFLSFDEIFYCFEGLVNRGVSLLCVTSMPMKLQRLLIDSTVCMLLHLGLFG
jgi:hypothetical protein